MGKLINKFNFKLITLYGIIVYIIFIPFMQNPYKPLIGSPLTSGKIQISDLVLFLVSPFAIYIIHYNYKYLYSKYKILIYAYGAYILSIFASWGNSLSSVILIAVTFKFIFLQVTILCISKNHKNIKYLGIVLIGTTLICIISSFISIILYIVFDIRLEYFIQENKVFPYLGEIVRITGPFKPTSKLFSTFLNLTLPLIIILIYYYKPKYFKTLICICILGIIIYPLTLSRGIGALMIGLTYVIYIISNNKYLLTLGLLSSIFVNLCILFVSSIYVIDTKINYSYNNEVKENPIYYYYHQEKGKENLKINIDFARDHYLCLKSAAVNIFKNNLAGIGIGNFQKEVENLEVNNKAPRNLSRHDKPQAEFFYVAAERGILGLIGVFSLFSAWLYLIYKNIKSKICLISFVSLLSIIVIDSFYMEILNFRFLWAYIGIILAYSVESHGDFILEKSKKYTC